MSCFSNVGRPGSRLAMGWAGVRAPELGYLGMAPRGRLVRVGVMSLSHSGL